jgi:hypothetical protein
MVWRLIPSKFLNGAGAPENSEQPGLHPLVETAELGTGYHWLLNGYQQRKKAREK